jgi:hypothetical protein
MSVNTSFNFFTLKNGPIEVSISVAARGLQVAASFGRSGRGPLPGLGNPETYLLSSHLAVQACRS